SGSAQWALEAPIFLKMFYFLGYHPAFLQAAYRFADSSTNIITPMFPYFVIVLAFMNEYDKQAGIVTLIALMLPYSFTFLTIWILLLLVFIVLGIPFGQGVGVYLYNIKEERRCSIRMSAHFSLSYENKIKSEQL